MVEKSRVEMSSHYDLRGYFKPGLFNHEVFKPGLFNPRLALFKNPGLKSLGLESPRLKNTGLKLGVEKSGVEMSFNLVKLL